MRYPAALHEAHILGMKHGNNAADWYWDRTEPTRADYLKVLKGIRDGDPEILDTFTRASLSGEYADGMTPQRLFEEIEVSSLNFKKWDVLQLDALCDMYVQGFNEAYERAVEHSCLENLRTEIQFVIRVEIEDQDPRKLLSKLTDLLAKENCMLEEERILDEYGEEMREFAA